MVYLTGDCHKEFNKFSSRNFPQQKEMTRDDIVIVCGDFGIWHNTNEEQYWFDWLAKKPFTLCFVDGNHDNFDRLYGNEFKVVDFHGGKAHKIRENIYHLMRGYIFNFEGKKFFAFGGASSHDIDDGILEPNDYQSPRELKKAYCDKYYRQQLSVRINHYSWWKQEMPTEKEMRFGLQTLAMNNNKVDYIITHCCPQEITTLISKFKPDSLTLYFNDIYHKVTFKKWFFGHYHADEAITDQFILLYHSFERVL